MQAGCGRCEITPRVGVELCGFGPFINRHSIAVRDRLWARALAVKAGGKTVLLVSCDLVGMSLRMTRRARQLVEQAAGIPPEAIMVHCTHTHSGPNTTDYIGWGDADAPYLEVLPQRIAAACLDALENLRAARMFHAEVPCEGIGQNREYDKDNLPLETVLDEAWRPAKPELTDTTCHVFSIESKGRLAGFFSSFGCHPVVCCQATRHIHGDYCGVATNLLEREHPGATGFFLQGAQGDVNTCVVHKPEPESLLALDIIAARYARAVRRGLAQAKPLAVNSVAAVRREVVFSRKKWTRAELRGKLAEQEKIIHAPGASDENREVRMATVYALALRKLIALAEAGQTLEPATEVHGLRLGAALFLGAPFEIFQAIKNDVKAGVGGPLTLVLGITNDVLGYAPDRTAAARGGYAADMVPLICGALPFARIHDELTENLLALAKALR